LFPFGHGLSYSSFELESLEVPAVASTEDSLTIRVRLTNAGQRDGDATPQVYVRPRVSSTVSATRLQGYRRVHLRAGQSAVVAFEVPTSRLAIHDPRDNLVVEPGAYDVTVGLDASHGLTGTFRLCGRAGQECVRAADKP
jgi:beta-glucosidase